MPSTTESDEVKLSLGRCTLDPQFFDTFYQIFVNSSPQIAPMFANTDMEKQRTLLRQGISMLLMFSSGSATAELAVGRLTRSHSKDNLNIKPELYPFWIDSLMKAIAQSDQQFSPALEKEWRTKLQLGIDAMKSGYDA